MQGRHTAIILSHFRSPYDDMRETLKQAWWSDQTPPWLLGVYLDVMAAIDSIERARTSGKLD